MRDEGTGTSILLVTERLFLRSVPFENILFYPAMAMNMALITIIGQLFGAARPDRIRDYMRKALIDGVILETVLTGIVLLFSVRISLAFVREKAVGQNGTKIGFADFNVWFHQLTGVNMTIYTITDWLGLVPIFICLCFGVMGLMQLMKRRSLLRVDPDILLLGVYYALVIACYLIFEMIPVNFRPVLMEGRLEASYPSSTTLLVLSVMPTLMFQTGRRTRDPRIRKTAAVFVIVFSMFMVIGRLRSGIRM